jgi:hypothetical protein
MKRDHFQTIEATPVEVQEIVSNFWNSQSEEESDMYSHCLNLVNELNKVGWDCDYGLDGEPYDLNPIPNVLPTVMDYSNFLDIIQRQTNIAKEEARKLYGKFTYVEWFKLLAT